MPGSLRWAAFLRALVVALAGPWFVSRSLASEAASCESIPRSDAGAALLQLSGDRGRLPELTPIAEQPAQAKLCAMQDNHCFDLELTARGEEADDGWPLQDERSNTAMPPEVVLVVARYHEDVQWLDALQDLPTILYNRGGSDTLLPQRRDNLRIMSQENTGREDEVMLRHIVDNYDNLPEITVFLQGWPFLHCPGALHTVARLAKEGGGLLPISRSFYQYSMEEGLVGAELSMARSPNLENKSLERWHALLQYKKICELVMGGKECPARQWVAEGAQWAVSRERIRSQPLELYKRALNLEEGFHSKLRGLVLEALWPVLWNRGAWSPKEMPVSLAGNIVALLDVPSKPSWPTPGWSGSPHSNVSLVQESSRRGKRADTVHGVIWASGKHCARSGQNNTVDRTGLLWSCEARMGFCEMEWRLARNPFPASAWYKRERSRFLADGTLGAVNEPWSMQVHLGAPFLSGAAAYLEVQAPEQEVWLRQREGQGTQNTRWNVMDWDSSNASSQLFVFAHRSDPEEPWRYLHCNSATGQVQVGLTKAGWQIKPLANGRFSFQADNGSLLRFTRGNPDKMRLTCMPADSEEIETVFSMELLERGMYL
mmetsp:Transcript_63666/g.129715  ORF Transcript_63666/g.129715 Transcript_63666/m.129715 type:complete len:600 (-) Transcript_63666:28-1827(-)